MSAKTKTKDKNLYLILDITPGSSSNEILHAYNRSKRTYSNDSIASYSLLEENESGSILEEVEHAYSILGSVSKRREYDLAMGFDSFKSSEYQEELEPMALPKNSAVKDQVGKRDSSSKVALVEESGSLPVKANPKFEEKIENCTQLSGAFIKAVRIYRSMTEEQLAQKCCLSTKHIVNLENEAGGCLHHPTYLRGHIVMVCQYLGIPNAGPLAKEFSNRLIEEKKAPTPEFDENK